MIYKIDINYKISGFGIYEETTLCGYEENHCFFLGNDNGFKFLIKSINDEKVTLELDKHSKLILPNSEQSKIIELKIGEEITPYLPIEPSPMFKIKITDIRKENRVFYS